MQNIRNDAATLAAVLVGIKCCSKSNGDLIDFELQQKSFSQFSEKLVGLDIMQSEKFMFMGIYTPRIIHLLNRLESFKGLKYCNVLKKCVAHFDLGSVPRYFWRRISQGRDYSSFFQRFCFFKNKTGQLTNAYRIVRWTIGWVSIWSQLSWTKLQNWNWKLVKT